MKVRLGGVVVVFALFAVVAAADSIVGVTFGNSGTAYWNNPSKDYPGGCANIGCVLVDPTQYGNAGATLGSSSVSTLSWGTNSGAVPSLFSLLSEGNGFTLSAIQDSTLNSLAFGYYLLSDPSTKYQLYAAGPNSSCNPAGNLACASNPGLPSASLIVANGQSYGFYVTVTYADAGHTVDTYYTSTALNTTNGVYAAQNNAQHFVIFQKGGSYYLGFEDSLLFNSAFNGLDSVEGMGDYQDFIVKLTANPTVPEPATFGLIALGLGGLALLRRRR